MGYTRLVPKLKVSFSCHSALSPLAYGVCFHICQMVSAPSGTMCILFLGEGGRKTRCKMDLVFSFMKWSLPSEQPLSVSLASTVFWDHPYSCRGVWDNGVFVAEYIAFFFLFLFFKVLLKYRWLKTLWSFLLYSRVIQFYEDTYIHLSSHFFPCTDYRSALDRVSCAIQQVPVHCFLKQN